MQQVADLQVDQNKSARFRQKPSVFSGSWPCRNCADLFRPARDGRTAGRGGGNGGNVAAPAKSRLRRPRRDAGAACNTPRLPPVEAIRANGGWRQHLTDCGEATSPPRRDRNQLATSCDCLWSRATMAKVTILWANRTAPNPSKLRISETSRAPLSTLLFLRLVVVTWRSPSTVHGWPRRPDRPGPSRPPGRRGCSGLPRCSRRHAWRAARASSRRTRSVE